MDPLISQYLIISAMTVLVFMCLLFEISLLLKRNDVADSGWGVGFIFVALMTFLIAPTLSLGKIIILILVGIWGIRLSTHIYFRNKNKPEDKRYQKWRDAWGTNFYLRSFLQVYILQGFFMLLISAPIIFSMSGDIRPYHYFFFPIGVVMWVVGFIFEVVGDTQLKRFLRQPENKGHIITTGLWRYTRHPNYFGEVVQWWGIWVISLGLAPWYMTIIGPLTISGLILFISGIPLTERSYRDNVEFQNYKERTSVFFPWFSKSKK